MMLLHGCNFPVAIRSRSLSESGPGGTGWANMAFPSLALGFHALVAGVGADATCPSALLTLLWARFSLVESTTFIFHVNHFRAYNKV